MRFLVADDHPLFREALRQRLERSFRGAIVLETSSLTELCALDDDVRADLQLILLDLHMPGMLGPSSVATVRECCPGTPVAVISGQASPSEIREALAHGAAGYLPKTLEPQLFPAALAVLLSGGTYVPAECLIEGQQQQQPAAEPAAQAANDPRSAGFSERDLGVLDGVALGWSNKEIARKYGLAEVTIKMQVSALMRRLDARNRAELATVAARTGLLPPRSAA
jgi:DNA-binding NarL/FixJ family response regulator